MAGDRLSPVRQLKKVLGRYRRLKKSSGMPDLCYNSDEEQTEVITSMVTAIERLAPKNTYYYTNMVSALRQYGNGHEVIPSLVGITESLKTAYESRYLYQIEELIHADLFSDFLDMAEYLLNDEYKDPAAVIIGGVLEEHLRKLCIKNPIAITIASKPKKADLMNSELAKANVYNVLDQKNVTAWLDLRNKAAHGKYSEYTREQVQLMLLGVRDFAVRLPA